MAVELTVPLWVSALVPEHRLERVCNTRILHTPERDMRVKFSDNVLDTALLQREALWLSRVGTLGVDTHQCLGFFKDGSRGLLTTTYIEGRSLSDVIREATPNGAQSINMSDIVLRLFREVEQLHQLGIVHGDIKPANIIVQRDGTLSLIDFSNARRVGELWAERGVSQSTQSFAYPKGDKSASPIHDYYALLVTILTVVGGSYKPLLSDFESWTCMLLERLQFLRLSTQLTDRVEALVKAITKDLQLPNSHSGA